VDFKPALKKGKLLKRYKRFFADIEYKSETLVAHVPNTGSLKTVPLKDTDCYFSASNDPKRKLKYTLEFINTPTGLAGTNTRTPNTIVHEALLNGLKGEFDFIQPELKISDSTRIDFVLWSWLGKKGEEPKKLKYPDFLKNKKLKLKFIEVKNVTMAEDETAFFPDGVTERGKKHLDELAALSKKGFPTGIIFTVQREDIKIFSIAESIDPKYFAAFHKAITAGVKAMAYKVMMNKKKVYLDVADPLQIKI
jgi:sugar fermentation stimulation protein A